MICIGFDPLICSGESALHTACRRTLPLLVRRLLDLGADPNALTASPKGRHKREDSGISFGGCNGHPGSGNPFEEPEAEAVYPEPARRSPLHLAVAAKDAEIATIFLERQREFQAARLKFGLPPSSFPSSSGEIAAGKGGIATDFQLRDAEDNTAFALSLWCELFDLATEILKLGTNSVEERSEDGLSLLHQAIQRQHTQVRNKTQQAAQKISFLIGRK